MLKQRRLKYFLRLDYPIHVTMVGEVFQGCFPDLPGLTVEDEDPSRLYARLESLRREWVTVRIMDGLPVPLPQSRLPAPLVEEASA